MPTDLSGTAFTEEVTYETYGCKVFAANPGTPDKLTPDVQIHLQGVADGTLDTPDGKKIKYWTFLDKTKSLAPAYLGPMIRVKQGQIVHTTLSAAKGPHTIHHHGIEPSTANDGVGHVSFEVNGSYTYQWQPQHAGTFFYHCHRNTVFHFEMGLMGMLIVDPPEGPGKVFQNGPAYDVEKIWVLDDMDPRWHEIGSHDAGLCGMDVGFNRFEPKYFLLSGVFNNRTTTDPRAVVTAPLGKKILIRLLNASYSVLRVTLPCDAICVSLDGHGLGKEAWNGQFLIPANTPFELATAQRFDLILAPTVRGTSTAKMEFRHWITGQIQNNGAGVVQTRIVVT
jgi:FtsP/CotA-like multicopper oxidase with cupredoxin domain